MINDKGICVVLSRHKLTPAQARTLAGYTIHQVHPPTRFFSAKDALVLMQNACGGRFSQLVVAVMPLGMLQDFVRLIGDRVPVVRGIFDHSCEPMRFVRWERVLDVRIISEVWTPEVRP